jgi:predicted HicB family RNase H-like nuclease
MDVERLMPKKPRSPTSPKNGPVTSVRIPSDLRKRAKIFAATQDLSLASVLSAALDEYLKKRGA